MLPADLKHLGERRPLITETTAGALAALLLAALILLDCMGAFA